MAVGLRVGEVMWPVGAASFFGAPSSTVVADLGNYFVTSEGRDLFDVLHEAVDLSARTGAPIHVR